MQASKTKLIVFYLILSLMLVPYTVAAKLSQSSQSNLNIGPQYENTLVLITPSNSLLLQSVQQAFQTYAKDKLGIDVKVELIQAGSPECMNRIIAWNGAPDADIFFGGDLIYHWKLKAKGLLEPYKPNSPEYDALPTTFMGMPLKDPDNMWHPKLWWGHGFMYNTEVLNKLKLTPPKSWDDLLDPKWKDLIVMCTPSRSSSTYINVFIIIQNRGWDKGLAFWRRLAANVGTFVQRSHDVLDLVSKGEYAVGFTYGQGVVINRYNGYPVSMYMDPTGFIVSGVSLLKGSSHPNIAKAFLDWWYTTDAQQVALSVGGIPVLTSVKIQGPPNSTAAILREYLGDKDNIYDYLKTFTNVNFYNFTYAESIYNNVSKIFDDEIVAKHTDLKNAWSAILAVQDKVKGISEAEAKLNDAMQAFDSGNYDVAKTLASEADTIATQKQAERSMITNLIIAGTIIIVAAVIVYVFLRRKHTP
jgi:iron(III) transport system substrate-binding protein